MTHNRLVAGSNPAGPIETLPKTVRIVIFSIHPYTGSHRVNILLNHRQDIYFPKPQLLTPLKSFLSHNPIIPTKHRRSFSIPMNRRQDR